MKNNGKKLEYNTLYNTNAQLMGVQKMQPSGTTHTKCAQHNLATI